MEVKIITYGDSDRVGARFKRYARNANNLRDVLEEIVLDMLRIEGIIFRSNGRRGGGSWRRLKQDTIRKKGTVEILRTRGAKPKYSRGGDDALFDSVTRVGAAHQIITFTKNTVELSTDAPGAAASQTGAPSRKIPARPFLRFLPSDVNRWSNMITEHLIANR